MFPGNRTRKALNRLIEKASSQHRRALRITSLMLATSIVFTTEWVPIDGFAVDEGFVPIRTASSTWTRPDSLIASAADSTAAASNGPSDTPTRVASDQVPGADTAAGPWFAHAADPAAEHEFLEALASFAAAELQLPAIHAYFHDSEEDCSGHMGLYGKGGDLHRIDICLVHESVILHEMAHLWERHNVDDATRQALMDKVGAAEWNRQETAIRARAMEQAADLVVWGVRREPIQLIHRNFYAEELERYEVLTGNPSPRIAHWDDISSRGATEDELTSIGPIEIIPTAVVY